MGDLPAVLISGRVSGSTYALLALAIVIIFRSTDTDSLATEGIGTLADFLASTLIAAGLPMVFGLLAAGAIAGLQGVIQLQAA
jgi:branched-chain amino acid transport system permease protein